MKQFTEKEAEEFLEKNKMTVVERALISKKTDVKKIKIKFPWVMKVSSKKIMHKAKIGGVKTNVNSQKEAEEIFTEMSKIENFERAMIQKQIYGKEIILGIKETPEFGHVIMFGRGGSKIEEEKDVSFRVLPIDKKEALLMMQDTKIFKEMNQKETEKALRAILALQEIIVKYPRISELDINPLMVNSDEYIVADARIIMK